MHKERKILLYAWFSLLIAIAVVELFILLSLAVVELLIMLILNESIRLMYIVDKIGSSATKKII